MLGLSENPDVSFWHGQAPSKKEPKVRSFQSVVAKEIQSYKYFSSVAAGHDRGIEARDEWVIRNWNKTLRRCYLRHITGYCRYIEFQPELFAICEKCEVRQHWCLPYVIDLLSNGHENLSIISKIPESIGLLTKLRINEWRLPCSRFLSDLPVD